MSGCLQILRQLEVCGNEQLDELVANIRNWEKSLSLLRRLDWKVCGIEHVRNEISFNGVPGRFGWESGDTPESARVAAIPVPQGTIGLAC